MAFQDFLLMEIVVSNLRELQDAVRILHGVESEHVGSAPVEQMRDGEVVWQGVVEVFALVGHPNARHAYAWSEKTNDPACPRRHVAVLLLPPIRLPGDAVKAAMSGSVALSRIQVAS
jgi:hypothetical protein